MDILRALPTTNYDPIYANIDIYKTTTVGGHQDDSGYLSKSQSLFLFFSSNFK